MQYQDFKEILLIYKKGTENIAALDKIGVDLFDSPYELSSILEQMLMRSMGCYYTEQGLEWISWFIYENEWGKRKWKGPLYERNIEGKPVVSENSDNYGAHDSKGKPICYSIRSLHKHLQKDHLKQA
jgi:hypothetical protein